MPLPFRVLTCCILVVFVAGAPALKGQQRPPAEFEELTALASAAYPELRTMAVHFVVTSHSSTKTTFRTTNPAVSKFTKQSEQGEPLLAVETEYGAGKVLMSYRATGTVVQAARNASLLKEMRRAKGLGLDVQTVVADARPQFGPFSRGALEGAAPWRDLESFTGPLTVRTISSLDQTSIDTTDPVYGFTWRVEAISHKQGNPDRSLVLQFEPFTGRLVGLHAN